LRKRHSLRRKLCEARLQGADRRVGQPRADVTDVFERIAIPEAQEQSADRFSRALPFRIAADDEVGGMRRFDLRPCGGAPSGLILAVLALRNDALEAVLDRGV